MAAFNLYRTNGKFHRVINGDSFNRAIQKEVEAGRSLANCDLREFGKQEPSDCNLTNGTFTNANFRGVDLRQSNLRGATMTGADMKSAWIAGIQRNGGMFTTAQLDSCVAGFAGQTATHTG